MNVSWWNEAEQPAAPGMTLCNGPQSCALYGSGRGAEPSPSPLKPTRVCVTREGACLPAGGHPGDGLLRSALSPFWEPSYSEDVGNGGRPLSSQLRRNNLLL